MLWFAPASFQSMSVAWAVSPLVFAGLGVEPIASCAPGQCSVPKPGSQPWPFIVHSFQCCDCPWKRDCPCIGMLLIYSPPSVVGHLAIHCFPYHVSAGRNILIQELCQILCHLRMISEKLKDWVNTCHFFKFFILNTKMSIQEVEPVTPIPRQSMGMPACLPSSTSSELDSMGAHAHIDFWFHPYFLIISEVDIFSTIPWIHMFLLLWNVHFLPVLEH